MSEVQIESAVAILLVSRGLPAEVRGNERATWITVSGKTPPEAVFYALQGDTWTYTYIDENGVPETAHVAQLTADSTPEEVAQFIIETTDFIFE